HTLSDLHSFPTRRSSDLGLQQKLFGFKAAEILKTINLRIEKLLDRDHQIGHAYFINKNESTIIDSFYKNIIPLLQEYFFGDYGRSEEHTSELQSRGNLVC